MHTADGGAAAATRHATGLGQHDFAKMRDKLLAGGLKEIAAATSKTLAEDDARARTELKCGTPDAEPGCNVTVRYLYQVLRGLPHEAVFAQIVLGFELASSDPRFVGLNLVMPEDWYVPIHDFNEHMAMLDYLHGVYPKVHISLHAGELAAGLVKPEDLAFHIRASVERGHAERIGHGVDVMLEKDPIGLMKEMAARNVLVEINLTSNDQILGVSGDDHPLPIYMKYGVPVAISTDDEGVARSDMTHEYLRAVEGYRLSYTELKRMTRQSLEHSFLPGQSLWAETKGSVPPGRRVRSRYSRPKRSRHRTARSFSPPTSAPANNGSSKPPSPGSRRSSRIATRKFEGAPFLARLLREKCGLLRRANETTCYRETHATQTNPNPVSPGVVHRPPFPSLLHRCRWWPSAEARNSALRSPWPSSTPASRIRSPSAAFEGWFAGIEDRALPLGDYSVSGMEDSCVVERKDLADLIQSFTTNRARLHQPPAPHERASSQPARGHRVADRDQIRISLPRRQSQPHHAIADRRARRPAPAFHLHRDPRTRRGDRRLLSLPDISV